jgi:hypothetical protein
MPSMVDTRAPAPSGPALFESPGANPTCLNRCRNAIGAQGVVLTALADVDAEATILATSVGGSGNLRMHLVSPFTADRLAEVLGLVPSPLPHDGWPMQWLGLVGEVSFVLTALPARGQP